MGCNPVANASSVWGQPVVGPFAALPPAGHSTPMFNKPSVLCRSLAGVRSLDRRSGVFLGSPAVLATRGGSHGPG
jgi:hypothetical protein